jgi:hypothetical protein
MGSLSSEAIEGLPHQDVSVRTRTFDDVVGTRVGRLAFIKCDVEGHEHEVLLGAASTILQDRPVVLIEIEQRHRSRPIDETFRWFLDRDYTGRAITASGLRPIGEFDVERDQLQYVGGAVTYSRPAPNYVSDFLFVPSEPISNDQAQEVRSD